MPIMRIIGASCLIASVAIGAGMLALPIATGIAGFWPALVALVLVFFYMLYCIFLVLEANLVAPEGSHYIGMVKRTLGPSGQCMAWVSYLLLLYSAVAAYIAGGGGLLSQVIDHHYPHALSLRSGTLLFVAFAVVLVFCGTRLVDYCNRLLTLSLLVAFIALLIFVVPAAKPSLLSAHHQVSLIWGALPLILLSYTAHLMVPSLRVYLDSQPKALCAALLIGSVIPLLMYVVWEYTVLGILPVHGAHSLQMVLHSQTQVADLVSFLGIVLQRSGLSEIVRYFSFFALITSFIGASLSLCHFLTDGLNLSQYRAGKWYAVLLTFLPPWLFAWYYPRGFTVALNYAGLFVAILFCLFPAIMVWRSRYHLAEKRPFRCIGGKACLLMVMLIALGIIGVQLLSTLGWLPSIISAY